MKYCKKCSEYKDENEFYKCDRYADGYFCYCKKCAITLAGKSYKKVYSTPDGRADRLNRVKIWNNNFPEKLNAHKAVSRIIVEKGYVKHHWSYNPEHYTDFILITESQHKITHKYIIYDQEHMMYRQLDGVLLDTKEAHIDYIKIINNAK